MSKGTFASRFVPSDFVKKRNFPMANKRISLLGIIICALAMCATVFLTANEQEAGAQVSTVPEGKTVIDATILRIKNHMGLYLIYQDVLQIESPDIFYEQAAPTDYSELLTYVKMFEEEVQKYPLAFFKRETIERVYFGKRLFYKGQAVEGFYHHPTKVIFFDFLRSRGSGFVQRHNIHHELYHAIEISSNKREDSEWAGFNIKDFVYGKQNHQPSEKNPINYFAPVRPGFVSDYAMMSPQEDKAEVFACLMISTQNKIIHRWMHNDQVLRKKIEYLKIFIYQYCPEMDENYWIRLMKL
ncbi:MAG: hypothetical protein A2Y04_05045 [Omnitrophica WOR_2 bacterium GWC2_45_7]|nr:MAG: hypothetical protein A2Y04_05045 [Omnitrophica WOR_2 bacterium GWC2_45_7]